MPCARPLLLPAAILACGLTVSACGHIDAPPTTGDNSPRAPHDAQPRPLLANVTASAGLTFVNQARHADPHFMPLSIGSGGALLDYDGDGRLDIFLLQTAGPGSQVKHALFQQTPAGTFRDVSAGSGLDVDGYGMGVAVGDVNNDGRVDVLVTEFGRLRLFINQSTRERPRFVDVTTAAGLENPAWGTSACFFDYNRDGWLDLVVVNYVSYDSSRQCTDAGGRADFCGPMAFPPVVARLFRNRGPQAGSPGSAVETQGPGVGSPTTTVELETRNDEQPDRSRSSSLISHHSSLITHHSSFITHHSSFITTPQPPAPSPQPRVAFDDVTIASGLAARRRTGVGGYFGDFPRERWSDIFVANDGRANHLWINRRDGTFIDEAVERGLAYNGLGKAEANMGIAIGDVDGDGRFDAFITHRSIETHTLWSQSSPGMFVDGTAHSGILAARWRGTGFGTALADLDNDGDLDLLLANGHVLRELLPLPPVSPNLDPFWRPYAQQDQLLLNDGHGKFSDVSERNPDFSAIADVSRGLACGDVDNDGRLDVLVTCTAQRPRLFRNVASTAGHWLLVRAIDPALRRDAYGAEIRVRAANQSWWRCVQPGYSYLTSNDPRAHFGLGAVERFDAIDVVWPDGREESFPGGKADQLIELRRGTGREPTR